jgi:hypothetical protein
MKTTKPGELYEKMKKKNWIAGAIKKPGALHKELGIASGKKIPVKTLVKAASKGGKLGKRARLAETLKGLKHKKSKKKGFIDSVKSGIKNVENRIGSAVRGKMNELKEADKNFRNRPNNSNYYGSNKDFLNKKPKKK